MRLKIRRPQVLRANALSVPLRFVLAVGLAGWLLGSCPRATSATITLEASWQPRSYAEARRQVLTWLDQAQPPGDFQARALWPEKNLRAVDGTALLERVVETCALLEPRAQQLVAACNQPDTGPLETDWLADPALPPLLRNHLRLYYGRWLAQHRLYDEVLQTLAGIQPDQVVDPAGLLFYQMVATHQLVELEESHRWLQQLLEQEQQLPLRYAQLAQLLARDLASLEEASLGHVARQMHDVQRRLEIGRAGKQVQVVEKQVLEALDRKIEQLEKQQQQGGGGNSSGGQSSTPLQESQLPAQRAPMQVEQKPIGNQSGWGDLPAQEREQALQQIGREFPAHYREIIEQYFRELADEQSPTR
jgi:hypothetical protein